MKFSLKAGLAAGLFAAVLGTANLAYAATTTVEIDPAEVDLNAEATTGGLIDKGICGDVREALLPTHSFGPGEFRTGFKFTDLVANDVHGTAGDQIELTEVAQSKKLFSWESVPDPWPTDPQKTFDFVVVVAKKINAYVIKPADTTGLGYGDVSSPKGVITLVVFCAVIPQNILPAANFDWAPAGPALTIDFTDTSTDADGDIVSWSWDFDNDGSEDSTEQNPTHTYPDEGPFTVTLTVTDNDDGEASIVVGGISPAILSAPTGCLLDDVAYTNVCLAFNASDFVVANSPVAVVFSHATVGNNYNSLCTCPGTEAPAVAGPGLTTATTSFTDGTEQVACDTRVICDDVGGGGITDCANVADPEYTENDPIPPLDPETGEGVNFCNIDAIPSQDPPCCGGKIATGPSGGVDSTPQAGSCSTNFTIGGITYTVTFDFGPPCPTFQ